MTAVVQILLCQLLLQLCELLLCFGSLVSCGFGFEIGLYGYMRGGRVLTDVEICCQEWRGANSSVPWPYRYQVLIEVVGNIVWCVFWSSTSSFLIPFLA
mmetsp:Transcript_19527/g.32124  ORF Transcript_19527/g.32124 Transcript_19527/m.32124 type:complete len:99 (-) Transcript_19527:283-579(-)